MAGRPCSPMIYARQRGGRFLLRIEDIDGVRSKEEHVAGILEDLIWLGINWDGEVVRQSQRLPLYEAALERLKRAGLAYPCFCTPRRGGGRNRRERIGSACPDGQLYPGTCRRLSAAERVAKLGHLPHCWRLDMAEAIRRAGPLTWRLADGGMVAARPELAGRRGARRKDAPTSYHLAATLDDAGDGRHPCHPVGVDLRAARPIFHRLLHGACSICPARPIVSMALLVDARAKGWAKPHRWPEPCRTARTGRRSPRVSLPMLRAGVGGVSGWNFRPICLKLLHGTLFLIILVVAAAMCRARLPVRRASPC